MLLPYVYQVTQYDPADFTDFYQGLVDHISDHGPREAAYLRAVAEFAHDSGIDTLTIREPGLVRYVNFGREPSVEGHGLAGLFPPDLTGFSDGASVSVGVATELVRGMLRDHGAWCRLEVEGRFFVHVGDDQYMYIGSAVACERAVAVVTGLGLFPVSIRPSSADEPPAEDLVTRRADDAFWVEVGALAAGRGRVLIEVAVFARPSTYHRVAPGDVAAAAGSVPPRASVSVWPDLCAVTAVLAEITAGEEDLDENDESVRGDWVVWQSADGTFVEEFVDPGRPETCAALTSTGTGAALLFRTEDERLALAVVPDPDGVLRARWSQ